MKIVLTFDSVAEMKQTFREFGDDPEALLEQTVGTHEDDPLNNWTTNAEVVNKPDAVSQARTPAAQKKETPAETVKPVTIQTTAPTVEESTLKTAMRSIVTTGGTAKLTEIMHELGVNAFPELPSERYPELAEKLRANGAAI